MCYFIYFQLSHEIFFCVSKTQQEDSDLDTPDLCSRRIKRIVACEATKCLVQFLNSGSSQTKEAAARALRQICVEPSVRGALIQQGALKACCTAASDEDNKVHHMFCLFF